VKFGIIYNTGQLGVDPSRIIAVARHAEDCGFESFYLPEHIALYPGDGHVRGGRRGPGRDG
jgi:alkanesulfonate monooxygenase SsuD/methylene tetrahydromethanopterin reductase-like flavin-dependent oxidoreductase (luciferase family)